MRKPNSYIEIFLQPGEHYFGDSETRIRTLLGSCIAVTFWHPRLKLGGMCHFLLPSRTRPPDGSNVADDDTMLQLLRGAMANRAGPAAFRGMDGRYGDEALLLLIREIVAHRTDPKDYEIKVFGGGDMFPQLKKDGSLEIGARNATHAFTLLNALHLRVAARHVGGQGHRSLIFDVWSGHVWVKHEQ